MTRNHGHGGTLRREHSATTPIARRQPTKTLATIISKAGPFAETAILIKPKSKMAPETIVARTTVLHC